MASSIVETNLHNYSDLRDAINDIRYKIFKGDNSGSANIFATNFNSLFPENINTITYGIDSNTVKLVTGASTNGLTTGPVDTDFKNLLHNSLYPYLHQTYHTGDSTTTIQNTHIPSSSVSKDHLCFFKFDNATPTNILPDEYAINNILYSIYNMEIFIKIIEALKDCYKNYSTFFKDYYTSSTKIFIVERKLKKNHDIYTPRGIFINTQDINPSTPVNGIYLYIGDLNNLFGSENITTVKCVVSSSNTINASEASKVDNGETNSSDDKVYIFTDNDKLVVSNQGNTEYYFNYLKIYSDVLAQTTVVSLTGAAYTDPKNLCYTYVIRRIFNFIRIIKYTKPGTDFSTTINYLHIYLLCLKSTLLSSVRAANIFFNNKYVLNAIAISYENNFLYNYSNENGPTGCSKLEFNNFIKNKGSVDISTSETCSGTNKLPINTSNPKEYKFLLYRKNEREVLDNAEVFKKYDKYLHDEIENTSSPVIDSASSELGIQYYTLFKDYYKIDGDYIIYSDKGDGHIENDSILYNTISNKTEYESIKNMFILNKTRDFNKTYRIKVGDDDGGYKVLNFTTYNNTLGKICVKIILQKNNNVYDPSNKLIDNIDIKQRFYNVYITKITGEDLHDDYQNIISYTNSAQQNINMYKSKIKNATTLYELYKSKNNLLFNQMISYIIIIIIVIVVLIIVNIAGVEKSLIKSISLACLGVIIVLIMSYYIMNTLYIEEGFQNSYYQGFELCPSSHKCVSVKETLYNKKKENDTNILTQKKDYVVSYLNNNAANLIILTNLIKPTIVNNSLKDTGNLLLMLSKNAYNEKKHINDVIINKKHDGDMNIDVIRYDNKNYDMYIVCILILGLIIISTYTINLYTDDKYLDLLLLIVMIMVICLFTYFILYTNRVVRTVSSNYYWGSEYKDEYI